jgi:micrococcal nuclease
MVFTKVYIIMKRQLAVLMMIGCLVLSGCTFSGNVSETPDDDSTVGDQRTEKLKHQQSHNEEEKANKQGDVMMIDCGSQEASTPQTPDCKGDIDDGGDGRTQTDEPEDTPSADETPSYISSPDTETPDDESPQTEEPQSTDDENETPPPTDDDSETSPSTEDSSETTPPVDDSDESTPPTEDGTETSPSTEDGTETPPTDDGGESTPPTDDGTETSPPTDDDNGSTPPTNDSNQTVESPIDGGTARLATVTEVIDGDTVTVEFQNGSVSTVQLIGVDAPEMLTLGTSPEKYGIPNTPDGREWLAKYGNKSKTFAENELAGQTVVIVTDPQSAQPSDRMRVYIYYRNGYDTSYQQRLLEQGYARVYTDATFVMKEEFISIETTAQENNVGLWGYESSQENETPENSIPKNNTSTNETSNNDTSTDKILESILSTNTTLTNDTSTDSTLTNSISMNETLNNGIRTSEVVKSETPTSETSTPRTDEP